MFICQHPLAISHMFGTGDEADRKYSLPPQCLSKHCTLCFKNAVVLTGISLEVQVTELLLLRCRKGDGFQRWGAGVRRLEGWLLGHDEPSQVRQRQQQRPRQRLRGGRPGGGVGVRQRGSGDCRGCGNWRGEGCALAPLWACTLEPEWGYASAIRRSRWGLIVAMYLLMHSWMSSKFWNCSRISDCNTCSPHGVSR